MDGFGGDWLKAIFGAGSPTKFPGQLSQRYFKDYMKGYESGVKEFEGAERVVGKEMLPGSMQRTGAPNDFTSAFNAAIGNATQQPNRLMPRNPASQKSFPFGLGEGQLPTPNSMISQGGDVSEAFGSGWIPGLEETKPGLPWDKILDPTTLGVMFAEPAGRAIGGRTMGKVAGAGAMTGLAASQGFANPVTDLMALYKILGLTGLV